MSLACTRLLQGVRSIRNNTENSTMQKATKSNDINSHTQETTEVKRISLKCSTSVSTVIRRTKWRHHAPALQILFFFESFAKGTKRNINFEKVKSELCCQLLSELNTLKLVCYNPTVKISFMLSCAAEPSSCSAGQRNTVLTHSPCTERDVQKRLVVIQRRMAP